MRLTIVLLLDRMLVLALFARPSNPEARSAAGARVKSGAGPPPVAAPREIWDAWLRFHEAEYCQGLDTVFVFHEKGMEVWCRIEDEKAFQRFSEILSPLHAAYQIDVYPTRPPAEKKQPDERNPPPSLWNNDELRTYLQDPFHPQRNLDDAIPRSPLEDRSPDFLFKQRMIMFAVQTLDWERRMNRYAGDLPALADAAFNSAIPEGIRSRAAAICLAHSQAVDKYADRLAVNMSEALPKSTRKGPSIPEQEKPASAASAPRDVAIQVAASAQSAARRIYRFIHPIHFTVELPDLREPSLLELLKKLHRLVTDLQGTLRKTNDGD